MIKKFEDKKMEVLKGDIYMIDLSPVISSEQKGRRPCLVVSNNCENTSNITIVPLTAKIHKKTLPTHVRVSAGQFGLNKDSIILAESIRAVDKKRFEKKLGSVDKNTLLKVENAIMINLGIFD